VAVELGSISNNNNLRTSTHPSMRAFCSLRGCRDMLSLGTGTRMGRTTALGAPPLRIARPRIVTGFDHLGVVLPFRESAPGATRWLRAPSAHAPPAHTPACRVEFDGGRAVVPERRRPVRVRPVVGAHRSIWGVCRPGSRACSTRRRARGSRRSHKDTDLGKRMDVTRRRGMDTGSMRDTYRSIRAQLPSIAMGSPCRNC
jgi:hypothetical protein